MSLCNTFETTSALQIGQTIASLAALHSNDLSISTAKMQDVCIVVKVLDK